MDNEHTVDSASPTGTVALSVRVTRSDPLARPEAT
jgi:hypothetical protein